jgi:uncharacterized protein YkwD
MGAHYLSAHLEIYRNGMSPIRPIRGCEFHIEMKRVSHQASASPIGRFGAQRKFLLLGLAIALLSSSCEQITDYLPPLPQWPSPAGDRESASPRASAQTAATVEMETAVRQQINEIRQQNGLNPLQNNEKLAQVARNYSRQMAENNFFSHTGHDGSTLVDRVRSAGIVYWVVGENLFMCRNLPQPVTAAVEGWMDSPGHRENILRSVFSETGIGVWQVGNTYYFTQLFLRR